MHLVALLAILSLVVPAGTDQPAKGGESKEPVRIYSVPVDKVFRAVAQVAAENWNLTHSDKDTFTVSFKTGANMRTWKGFDLSAVCVEQPDGSTRVRLHPQKRASGQLYSWNEGGRVISQFFEALDRRVMEMGFERGQVLPK